VPIVLKSGSLNLLEPYGPVQACNGIVLYVYIKGAFVGVMSGQFNLLRDFRTSQLVWLNKGWNEQDTDQAWSSGQCPKVFWLESIKEKVCLAHLHLGEKIILNWNF